eukprot:TRINITY_DN398_c0_g5_i2.p1 TRINITY_DN398_c0_g5~~TRINITY_DN398_c0_g5_i2.p1  ORF type:complete len:346 (+),score=70.27 TRINITY_DN398_c0_g5_i2:343-1380(+)
MLVLRLLSQTGEDTDRLLTWKDAPVPMESDMNKVAYQRTFEGKRNVDVYTTITNLLSTHNVADLMPWCKTIGLMMALSEPLPIGQYGAPLQSTVGGQPWDVVDHYRQLIPGHVLGVSVPMSCSQSTRKAPDPKGTLNFNISGVNEGIYIGSAGQYIEEDEVILPPFSVLSVERCTASPKGIEIDAKSLTVLGSYDKGVMKFKDDVVEDLEAGEERLRKVKELLGVHEQLKALPKKSAQKFTPTVHSSKQAQFEKSKQMWQDREDWAHTRDAVLSRDWSLREEREVALSRKHQLLQSQSFQAPPSVSNLGPTSFSYGASPSMLSKKQRDLEHDYQRRLESKMNPFT